MAALQPSQVSREPLVQSQNIVEARRRGQEMAQQMNATARFQERAFLARFVVVGPRGWWGMQTKHFSMTGVHSTAGLQPKPQLAMGAEAFAPEGVYMVDMLARQSDPKALSVLVWTPDAPNLEVVHPPRYSPWTHVSHPNYVQVNVYYRMYPHAEEFGPSFGPSNTYNGTYTGTHPKAGQWLLGNFYKKTKKPMGYTDFFMHAFDMKPPGEYISKGERTFGKWTARRTGEPYRPPSNRPDSRYTFDKPDANYELALPREKSPHSISVRHTPVPFGRRG